MIEQCLQKNPADRPTAKQLLKHDFFKKAKDRSYIAKHLALKFQDRKKMEEKIVNRRKPQSVRAVRVSDSGEWKFSSGSDDEGASGNEASGGGDTTHRLPTTDDSTLNNIKDLKDKVEPVSKTVSIVRFLHQNAIVCLRTNRSPTMQQQQQQTNLSPTAIRMQC
jgi:serine/threonine protein kinase